MLVLSRNVHQTVVIGEDAVRVHVLDVDPKSKSVKLGFEADKGIKIHRKEIFAKITGRT